MGEPDDEFRDCVREIAAAHGFRDLTDAQVDGVAWNKTGFPCFWPDADKTPLENFRMQLEEFFAAAEAELLERMAMNG